MTWFRANWPGLALGAVVLAAVLAASSGVVGLAWDDGVYVAAGQALAHGKGYLLANRIGDQAVPLYPAGYPLLVALAWLVAGSQSATFAALALFSGLCVSIAVFLWWRILRDVTSPGTAALLVAVPALSYTALLTGELRMADAPYVLLVAAAAALWRRSLESRWAMLALVLVAGAAVPFRTAGVVLPLAVALLLLVRRRWAPALAVVAAAGALHAVLLLTLRTPEPSYAEIVRAAWAHGGAGFDILRANLSRDVWTSVAALVAPPIIYSSVVQRLVHGAGALRFVYALAVWFICLAVAAGGWRRLRAERWEVGDLTFVGAVALIFVMPLGMLPRFLVPVGPVLALWAWEGAGALGARWSKGLRVALLLVLAFTAVEAVRHVRSQPRVFRERAAAYAAAGEAARVWLGRRGLIAAEFPETLWFEDGVRAVSTTTPLENVQTAQVGLDAARRRLEPIARGCLLDTQTFPVSGEVFDAYAARPGAVVLGGLDRRYVRAVCWGT